MGSDRRVHGFADLHFAQSAHLAIARAGEIAQTDVEADFPEAFAVEDRRLQFSIDARVSAVAVDGFRRLLEALIRDATSGDAWLEVESGERWAGRARGENAPGGSGARDLAPQASGSDELDVDDSETRPTMRTGAG